MKTIKNISTAFTGAMIMWVILYWICKFTVIDDFFNGIIVASTYYIIYFNLTRLNE